MAASPIASLDRTVRITALDRPDRTDRIASLDRPDRTTRITSFDRTDRTDRADRVERTNRADRADRADRERGSRVRGTVVRAISRPRGLSATRRIPWGSCINRAGWPYVAGQSPVG